MYHLFITCQKSEETYERLDLENHYLQIIAHYVQGIARRPHAISTLIGLQKLLLKPSASIYETCKMDKCAPLTNQVIFHQHLAARLYPD